MISASAGAMKWEVALEIFEALEKEATKPDLICLLDIVMCVFFW